MKLTVAVCDDNNIELNNEAKLISKILNEKGITNTVKKYDTPEKLLSSSAPYDIVFLDVEMDELNGIETAKKLKKENKNCLIIFITNYWDYLDNAFAVNAFRYWKKPLDEQQLSNGINSAIKELNGMHQTITVTVRSGKVDILVKSIVYVYVSNKITRIVSLNGEIYTYDTYKSIYDVLSGLGHFGEPYRGYCVNFFYVQNYTQDKLICTYQEKTCNLRVSRRKFEEFDRAFNTWLGGK